MNVCLSLVSGKSVIASNTKRGAMRDYNGLINSSAAIVCTGITSSPGALIADDVRKCVCDTNAPPRWWKSRRDIQFVDCCKTAWERVLGGCGTECGSIDFLSSPSQINYFNLSVCMGGMFGVFLHVICVKNASISLKGLVYFVCLRVTCARNWADCTKRLRCD